MKFCKIGQIVFFTAATLLAQAAPEPAQAQFSIEIGLSKDKALRAMVAQGYDQIKVLKKGFKTLRAHACLDGVQYRVRVDHKYRVRQQERVGVCRRGVTKASLEDNLERSGYSRIVFEEQNGNFVAIACKGNERQRIVFSRQGQILQQRRIGRCEEIFQPNDVRKVLRDQGYNRIKFIDRQLPWYRAEACNRGRKFELLLTRFGEVRRSVRIGKCAPPLDGRRIASHLEERGYDRVEVIDDQLPTYQAGACFNGEKVVVELDRFGTITRRDVTGRCPAEMREQEIVELLEREGFTRINVQRTKNREFAISACFDGYQKLATLSRYGELLSERDGDRCGERSLSDVKGALSGRGFKQVEFYAEGCRQGRKIRIILNERGERIGRERVGNC